MKERFYCEPLKINEDTEVMAICDKLTDKKTHSVETIVELLNKFNNALVAECKKEMENEKDLKAIIREYRKLIRVKDSQIKALNKIIAKLMRE